jgi:hypothetical protein
MTQLGKRIAIGLGVLILIPVILFLSLSVYLSVTEVPSKIADFHPSSFQAKANARFFYSIGDELKYSDRLDPQSPTLMRGEIKEFLVSPDSKRIAVVSKGVLTVVESDHPEFRRVAAVDSIFREPKPLGQDFFRDDDFQWSRDSKTLYLIKDQYYESKGSQLFSTKGELWKYEVEAQDLQRVLKPFPAFHYFLGLGSGIYFSVPTDQGDLQLKYYDGNRVADVGAPNEASISLEHLTTAFVEQPFFSFSIIDYDEAVLLAKGVTMIFDKGGGPARLEIRDKPYLALTQGNGLKGPYWCDEMLRSVFLPGDRYFLMNVPYCGNYQGQLLIDTVTGEYQRLPKGSRVYLTLNTDSIPHYRITGGGIEAK